MFKNDLVEKNKTELTWKAERNNRCFYCLQRKQNKYFNYSNDTSYITTMYKVKDFSSFMAWFCDFPTVVGRR